jgi:hypothetical protein
MVSASSYSVLESLQPVSDQQFGACGTEPRPRKTADRGRELLPITRNVVNGSRARVGRNRRECRLWDTQVAEKKLVGKPLNRNLGDIMMHKRDGNKSTMKHLLNT